MQHADKHTAAREWQPGVDTVTILVSNVLLEEVEYTASCFYPRALCH